MASDEIVWQIINQQFCSFKLKTTKNQNFCRNEYNVTGLCNRQSCPLANSRYATIRAHPDTGVLYLYMKTIERAHTPAKLWQRIKLSQHYPTALAQIDERLPFWPKWLIHKCKQRLTRLTQVAIRSRRLAKEEERLGEKVVPKLAPKVRRREATRERKAEAAVKLERAVERELLDRLRSGAYGDKPLNVEEGIWKKVLRGLERGGEGKRDVDLDDGVEIEDEQELEEELEEEVEEDDDGTGAVEYVSDIEESDEGDVGDLEEWLGERDQSESEEDSEGEEEEDDGSQDEGVDEDETGEESGVEDFTSKRPKPGTGAKRKRGDTEKSAARKKTKPRMEIEYETEMAPAERERVLAR